MKPYTLSLCLLLCLAGNALYGQDLHSIVTEFRIEVESTSMRQYTEKGTTCLTILDEKGVSAATFVCHCGDFSSLTEFSGEIYDAQGKLVRKIKKSELQKNEYSSALQTDDYQYYYICHYPSYPFSVRYRWKRKCHDGFITYPPFAPQQDYGQLVQKASYRISLPIELTCRYHKENFQGQNVSIQDTIEGEKRLIEATVSLLPPIQAEPFSPPASKLFPIIRFAPTNFLFDHTEGNLSTWETYGKWQYSLLKGRSELPPKFRTKLHQVTADCTTDLEHVKALYEYLAHSTRYVSIQLGIGGLQPIPASEVCRTGFGDCKGLSLFMHAMLKELGIPSVYTVISTQNERLWLDFASVDQMNHVILQVPLSSETLWLECTNAHLPFGYVHQDIAGHDALLVTPEGGKLCRLPHYPDSLNSQSIDARIHLTSSGKIQGTVQCVSRLFRYEPEAAKLSLPAHEQKARLLSRLQGSQAEITDYRVQESKDSQPSITANYAFTLENYDRQARKKRLFIPVNLFRKGLSLSAAPRHNPIEVRNGYLDEDSIRLQIPPGYTVEYLPRTQRIETEFGSFLSSVHGEGEEIKIVQRLLLRTGSYPKECYEAFTRFLRQVNQHYQDVLILKQP